MRGGDEQVAGCHTQRRVPRRLDRRGVHIEENRGIQKLLPWAGR